VYFKLCHAVAASLPVSEENLLRAIESESGPFKSGWDNQNHRGRITEEEFFDPDCGLFAWILAHLQELHRAVQRKSVKGKSSVPDVRSDAAGWFDFFDDKSIGSLSLGEVLRGMFASLQISALEDRRHSARNEIVDIWQRAGVKTQSVSKNDFLRPGGLASMLGAALDRAGVPSGEVPIAAMALSPPRQLNLKTVSQTIEELPPAATQPQGSWHSRSGSRSGQNSTAGEVGHALFAGTLGLGANRQTSGDSEEIEADTNLATLLAMGFPLDDGRQALRRAGGNVELAVGILLGTADADQGSSRRTDQGSSRRTDQGSSRRNRRR